MGAGCGKGTEVSIDGDRWLINGRVTYAGTPAEGLLMNARMVNAVFEDSNRDDFDPEENTDRFLAAMPGYVDCGVRAFTLNLQGGMPGYEGARNSAYEPDGRLRQSYLSRVERVIRAADRAGAVVILGCFYQRQDQYLSDEKAVRNGVVEVCRWIEKARFANVVLEIANEFVHPGYDHEVFKTAEGQAELIDLAKRTYPGLTVSTSGLGNGRLPDPVARAADFLLIHFNNTPVDSISGRVAALKKYGKPIVCNEDDKTGDEGAAAAGESVAAGCSWGVMLNDINQYQPFEFNGPADDLMIYQKIKSLTGG
jgi:hypothetical protein